MPTEAERKAKAKQYYKARKAKLDALTTAQKNKVKEVTEARNKVLVSVGLKNLPKPKKAPTEAQRKARNEAARKRRAEAKKPKPKVTIKVKKSESGAYTGEKGGSRNHFGKLFSR